MKHAALAIVLLSIALGCSAQSQRMRNLPNFDMKKYHFGFLLSINSSDFAFQYKPDYTFADSLQGISNQAQSGFNLALLASLDLTPNIHLRFLPGLSFQDRGLDYRFLRENEPVSILKRTESVFLEFPLLLKLRTNRVNNFAAYGLIGGKYGRDMQSQKDVNNLGGDEVIIRLRDNDFAMEVGGGFDFFLPFFKLSIEMKTAFGFQNLLIQEPTIFAEPLESLRTRMFVFSIAFEG
ncbi:MAG: porin family protein [Flavobacteriales bacterium]|nr:porin family protein [Flavobacteriales bacterium]